MIDDKLKSIKDLKELFDAGTISQDEFDYLKCDILNSNSENTKQKITGQTNLREGVNDKGLEPGNLTIHSSKNQIPNLGHTPVSSTTIPKRKSAFKTLAKYSIALILITGLINYFNDNSDSSDSSSNDFSSSYPTSSDNSSDESSEDNGEYLNSSSTESTEYYTDGQSCTWCKMGRYVNGTCNQCGTVSDEKERRFKADLREKHSDKICHFCQGTGRISGGECVQCIGTGVRY